MSCKEIGYFDDLDAAVVAKLQEVVIAGDDELRACRHRAFEHPVVVGIDFHDIQRDGWVNALDEFVQA